MKVPIDKIIVENRDRTDIGKLNSLKETIRTYGLLQPISIDENFKLIYGERRLRAVMELSKEAEEEGGRNPWKTIEVRQRKDLSPLESKQMELIENIERKDLTWDERAKAVSAIHFLAQDHFGATPVGPPSGTGKEGWGVDETAEMLGMSRTQVYQDLELAGALESRPEIKDMPNRAMAYKRLKRGEEKDAMEELAKRSASKVHTGKLHVGDCRTILRKLKDESVDLVFTDPPWGIGFQDMARSGPEDTKFDDFQDEARAQFIETLPEIYRVMKPNTYCLVFYSIAAHEIVQAFHNIFEFVEVTPFIWVKNSASAGVDIQSRFGQMYEPIWIMSKGYRDLNSPFPNVYHDDIVPPTKRISDAQKPLTICRLLIDLTCNPGGVVLDPYMGSGSICCAAIQKNRSYIGIDNNKDTVTAAQLRLSALETQLRENPEEAQQFPY